MGLFRWLFRRMCYRIFRAVDDDKSGFIERTEIEVAIYRLYNIINKRIPGWSDPPGRPEIKAALNAYDTNGDQRLDRDEFVEFARGLVKNAVIRTAILDVDGRLTGLKRLGLHMWGLTDGNV